MPDLDVRLEMGFVAKLKMMPETLAGVCCLFLVFGPIAILAVVIPSDGTDDQGDRITHAELWSSWDGPIILLSGLAMIAFSVGVLRRSRKIRFLWPAFFLGMLIHAVLVRPDEMIHQMLASVAWLFITLWYFFRRSTVVQYFNA